MPKGKYSAGDKTKEKLFDVALKLFYEKGFENTTYDDIAKAVDANRALIIYHFETKMNLAYLVWERFCNNLNEATSKLFEELSIDRIELKTVMAMFLYYRLLANINLTRFLVEIQSQVSYRREVIAAERSFFKDLQGIRGSISEENFHLIAHFDYGIEKELINVVYHHGKVGEIDKMTEMEIRMVFSELGFSLMEIGNLISEAKKILNGHSLEVHENFEIY